VDSDVLHHWQNWIGIRGSGTPWTEPAWTDRHVQGL
jgi:hypothetical protein